MLPLRGQSGPGSNGNEGVLRIPQSSSTAGTSPSDCLVSYPGHSLGGGVTPLQRSSRCILQPQPTGQSHCFGFTAQEDSFKTARRILVYFLLAFFSKRFVKVQSFWIASIGQKEAESVYSTAPLQPTEQTTSPGQCELRSNCNEALLCTAQSLTGLNSEFSFS